MTNRDLNIPEPTLPEHALISESAPVVRLSSDFRNRVLSDCGSSIAQAKAARRWKITGAVTAFLCLTLLISVTLQMIDSTPAPVVEQPVAPAEPKVEPYDSSKAYSSGSSIAVEQPKPLDNGSDDSRELIEELSNRMRDANILF